MKKRFQQLITLAISLFALGCMTPALKQSTNPDGETPADGLIDPAVSLPPRACPETIFPHPEDWKEAKVHGTCVADIGVSDCQQCHGQNLEGQAGPACSNCHHPEGWREVSQHSTRFVFQLPTRSDTTCMVCHGKDYSGGLVGVGCGDCHRPSHLANWREPTNHGARYCEQRGGDETNFCNLEGAQEADCFNCHRGPVAFDANYAGVEPTSAPPPSCYQCHATFPHIGYEQIDRRTGELVVFPWKRGHRMMLLNNNGLFPGNDLNAPRLVEAVRNTCGDGGGCHTNGRFSLPRGNRSAACATVCHR